MQGNEVTITGTGSSLPQRVVTNDEIPGYRAASGMWTKFWGVKNRYMLSEHEDLVDLGSKAVLNALSMAGLAAGELDAVIVGGGQVVINDEGLSPRKKKSWLSRLYFQLIFGIFASLERGDTEPPVHML